MPLKHVLSVMGLVDHPETPKLWAIAVGVLDTGVSRSTCSWAPSSAHLQPRGGSTTQATEKTQAS
jgi:hypothetical protein